MTTQAPVPKGFLEKFSYNRKNRKFAEKFGKQTFLIYSMGKVGSSTLKASFEANYPFLPAFQIHFLSDYWLKEKLPSMTGYYQVHIGWAEDFYRYRETHKDDRLKIITLVREPVIRDISDLFENGREYFQTADIESVNEADILARLQANDFSYTLNWFDTEFKAWTGIDIYEQPFDKQKGFSVWKFKDFDVLCLKLERLDDVMKEAMLNFSGFPFGISEKANLSEKKPGKDLYRNVVKKFRLTPQQEQLVFNSKLLNHFYTQEEIAGFRKKWVQA